MTEPIALPTHKYTLFPITDSEAWQKYKNLEALFWTAQEISMASDIDHWKKMSLGEQAYYEHILAFFAMADELIIGNIENSFLKVIQRPEIRYFYIAQAQQEAVHSEAYSIQVDALISDSKKKQIFNGVISMPVISLLKNWIIHWTSETLTLGEKIFAFAVVEGILFQGHFMSIQLLKERNICPGLTGYNEFIARDEGEHCKFGLWLVMNRIKNKPSTQFMVNVIKSGTEIAVQFIAGALSAAFEAEKINEAPQASNLMVVPGITYSKLKKYLENFADHLCTFVSLPKIYNSSNPYPETLKLALNATARPNIFDVRPTQYQNVITPDALTFTL